MSRFYNPVTVYSGPEGCNDLAVDLDAEWGWVKRVLILTRGESVERKTELAPLMAWADARETTVRELALSNPGLEDVLSLHQDLKALRCQLIIAIGGGSVMDVAKSLAATTGHGLHSIDDLRTLVSRGAYGSTEKILPWIGIPTTSGTGSEVTKWATVWDREQGCKRSIVHNALYARMALIVPELTRTLPLNISASTALDAMCQATEAYWSKRTNPITRTYALAAIREIRIALPLLKGEPQSPAIREKLALASLHAGLAFSNTQTTACHSISYPLTLLRGIDHGIAVSLTLAPILQLNESTLIEKEKLFSAFGVERAEEVEMVFRSLFDHYGIPKRLSDHGVTKEDIPKIVEGAYTKGRMDNNPVAISEAQLTKILQDLL